MTRKSIFATLISLAATTTAVIFAQDITTFINGTSGNGEVKIVYDPSTDSCPTALVVAPEFTG